MTATPRQTRSITALLFVVGAAFFAKDMYRALKYSSGDFYGSLPGAYAQTWNPALWASPDMQPAIVYNHGAYLYGPTQYLTLFPIVFLDSYHAIALALLIVYAPLLLVTWYILWRLLADGEPSRPVLAGAGFAAMFAFLPLAQTLIQREFEVVGFFLLVVVCAAFVRGRDMLSGAALAALVWFKYWPIVLLAAFVVHMRWKGLAAFAVASALLLGAAHLAFGLERFRIQETTGIVRGLLRPLGSGDVLYAVIERGAAKSDFCRQWIWGRGTQAEVRWALCGVEDRRPALSAKATFYTLVAATTLLFAWGALRMLWRGIDAGMRKWAVIWEFSALTIGGASFLHAHYYYYIVFLLPLLALLVRYVSSAQPWRRTKVALWLATYVLVNALIVPTTWLSAWMGRDAMDFYLNSSICLVGTLMLLGLVLWEFTTLPLAGRATMPEAA